MYLYNPTKKVITIMLSLVGVFLVILALSSIKMFEKPKYGNVAENYPLLSEMNVFEEISPQRALEFFTEHESGIIVFGFPACPWCQQLLPELDMVSKKCGGFIIYYVDIKDMRDNLDSPDHPTYLLIKEKVKKALDVEKDRINAPTIVTVANGNIIDYHLDTVPSHQMVNGQLPEMTIEQKRELSEILTNMIKTLYNIRDNN